MDAEPKISIVIPLFNEIGVFTTLIQQLDVISTKSTTSIEIVLVDDGSIDGTSLLVIDQALKDSKYQAVILSRNFGHQKAISAGLKCARASDAIMILDADLQDPPELLFDFYEKIKNGFDVVYGIRKKRKDMFLKVLSYKLFYRILKRTSYISIPIDSGDFCMMSRRVVNIINIMPEQSRFIRGLRSWVGFKQVGVEYERRQRYAGKSNYSFSKLLQLAFDGLFNFSYFPVKTMTSLGFISILTSLFYFIYVLYIKIFIGDMPSGFTATIFLIILFGGIQLISLGILGEYIMRIFFQSKERPLYIIDKMILNKEIQTINYGKCSK